jgi:ArsR family transcriptional regulator
MSTRPVRPDDPDRLRRFKADFFKALTHPTRIAILERLRDGPLSVGELAEAIGIPPAAVSQQLALLRSRGIVDAERSGTTMRYSVPDADVYALLDVGRRIFFARLADTVDLLRLVESEAPALEGSTGGEASERSAVG